MSAPLLEARGLRVAFRVKGGTLRALDGVDLTVGRGETVAVVGESGSGKSTLALTVARVHAPAEGRLAFDGRDYTHADGAELRALRRRVQMVFQDPYASLDPRWPVWRSVTEGLAAHGLADRAERRRRADALLEAVGLPADAADRLPAQFSGGQRQRIAIARALALEPDLLIADEPVSALDVSVQAQIVALLADLRARLGIATLLIAHDLALVYQISDRVLVMYLGRVVETGPTEAVVGQPDHPYTVALLAATPEPVPGGGGKRLILQGEPASAADPPPGCPFHPRCPIARDRCRTEPPPLAARGGGRAVACHYPGELVLG